MVRISILLLYHGKLHSSMQFIKPTGVNVTCVTSQRKERMQMQNPSLNIKQDLQNQD